MKQLTNMLKSSFPETLPDGFPFDMIFVEGDTFWMGTHEKEPKDKSNLPQVTLDSYHIGKYPVTQGLWKAVMGADNNPSYFQGDDRPVEMVNWQEANNFIDKLNEMTNRKYRLPSEAQWEFAARGGKQSQEFEYAGSNKLKEVGWYRDNSHRETKPVGLKAANELEIFDMSGNVWEWCQDSYKRLNQSNVGVNQKGPDSDEYRVIRGGSWAYFTKYCNVFFRQRGYIDSRRHGRSFRLALPQFSELPEASR